MPASPRLYEACNRIPARTAADALAAARFALRCLREGPAGPGPAWDLVTDPAARAAVAAAAQWLEGQASAEQLHAAAAAAAGIQETHPMDVHKAAGEEAALLCALAAVTAADGAAGATADDPEEAERAVGEATRAALYAYRAVAPGWERAAGEWVLVLLAETWPPPETA